MNALPGATPERRALWFGAPGADDRGRSRDEIRIIKDMCNEEVELFLQINQIDTAAAKELRCEPPHVALAVLERGPLRACTNPSGALVARIRDAKRGILSGNQGRYGAPVQPVAQLDPNASEGERFLAENRIDVAGAASFRAESVDIQKLIMSKGPLTNSTNPSASLMARIRNVKANVLQGGGIMPVIPGMPGLPGGPLPPGQVAPGSMPAMAGLVTGGGGAPPPPGPPPPGPPPPGPPPLQLEDGGKAAAIEDDVQKAINKLMMPSAPPAAQPPGMMQTGPCGGPMPPGPAAVPPGPCGGGGMGNSQDQALQQEALKAIQALNMQS